VDGHDLVAWDGGLLVETVDVLRVETRQLAGPRVQQLKEAVRYRRLPLVLARAEDERAANLQIRKRGRHEHVLLDDVLRITLDRRPLARRGRDRVGRQRGVHAAGRSEIRNAGCARDACARQNGDTAACVRRDELGDASKVADLGHVPRCGGKIFFVLFISHTVLCLAPRVVLSGADPLYLRFVQVF
jgi:hypothetical protein